MSAVPSALAKALGQLGDPAVRRVAGMSIAITLALFALIGAGLYVGLADLAGRLGWDEAWAGVATVVLVPLMVWFLFRTLAMAVLPFFADAIVEAVEQRHYPVQAALARPLPLRREIAYSLRGLVRAVGFNFLALPLAAVLAFTAVGPGIVFLAVNAALLGRELTDMAWLRHCGEGAANPVGGGERFLLGLAIAALMLVPVLGVIAPVLGAAAGTHLVLRRIESMGSLR